MGSPTRLKVRWDVIGAFREHEARWNRIDALGIGDEPAYWAADAVFETLIDHGVARMEWREAGVCRSTDSVRLAELTGPKYRADRTSFAFQKALLRTGG